MLKEKPGWRALNAGSGLTTSEIILTPE